MGKTFIEYSKEYWEPNSTQETPTIEQVNTGCLQRIASATEVMAQNYIHLQAERDKYKRWYEIERRSNETLANRIRGLRGTITRMKNKIPN